MPFASKRISLDHGMPHSLCWSSPEWALGKLSLSMREDGTPFTYNISAKAKNLITQKNPSKTPEHSVKVLTRRQ